MWRDTHQVRSCAFEERVQATVSLIGIQSDRHRAILSSLDKTSLGN